MSSRRQLLRGYLKTVNSRHQLFAIVSDIYDHLIPAGFYHVTQKCCSLDIRARFRDFIHILVTRPIAAWVRDFTLFSHILVTRPIAARFRDFTMFCSHFARPIAARFRDFTVSCTNFPHNITCPSITFALHYVYLTYCVCFDEGMDR